MKFKAMHEAEPVTNKRPRGSNGVFYNVKEYSDYKNDLAMVIRQAMPNEWPWGPEKRYALSLLVYRSRDIGDLDNYTKTVCDALELAGAVKNDKQIIQYKEPFEMRIDRERPRVELVLEQLGRTEK